MHFTSVVNFLWKHSKENKHDGKNDLSYKSCKLIKRKIKPRDLGLTSGLLPGGNRCYKHDLHLLLFESFITHMVQHATAVVKADSLVISYGTRLRSNLSDYHQKLPSQICADFCAVNEVPIFSWRISWTGWWQDFKCESTRISMGRSCLSVLCVQRPRFTNNLNIFLQATREWLWCGPLELSYRLQS